MKYEPYKSQYIEFENVEEYKAYFWYFFNITIKKDIEQNKRFENKWVAKYELTCYFNTECNYFKTLFSSDLMGSLKEMEDLDIKFNIDERSILTIECMTIVGKIAREISLFGRKYYPRSFSYIVERGDFKFDDLKKELEDVYFITTKVRAKYPLPPALDESCSHLVYMPSYFFEKGYILDCYFL